MSQDVRGFQIKLFLVIAPLLYATILHAYLYGALQEHT